jgi:hypothetical protein
MEIKVKAEIATKWGDLATGLMGRKHLPRNAGMLFDFGNDRPLSFWMQNTYIPLSIAFIDSKGTVKQIENMVPLSTRAIRSHGSCRYALEVNEGWFDDNSIFVGAQVAVPFTPPVEGVPPEGQPGVAGDAKPDVVIEQSYKDILKAADDYGVKLIIEYVTKDGKTMPPRSIEAPIEFTDTQEGDADGIAVVWDASQGDYRSYIIENILSIKDGNGNPVANVEQVRNLAMGTPLNPEEEKKVQGKEPIPAPIPLPVPEQQQELQQVASMKKGKPMFAVE